VFSRRAGATAAQPHGGFELAASRRRQGARGGLRHLVTDLRHSRRPHLVRSKRVQVPRGKNRRHSNHQPCEYQEAVEKSSAAIAQRAVRRAGIRRTAIALAPTPYAKWLTCRVAMEGTTITCASRSLPTRSASAPMKCSRTRSGRSTSSNSRCKRGRNSAPSRWLRDLAEILQVETAALLVFAAAQRGAHYHAGGTLSRPVRLDFCATCARRAKGKRACRMQ